MTTLAKRNDVLVHLMDDIANRSFGSMAKTRRNYGWGCPTCNMQCAGFADADGAWQEASIHTTSSGHVTDTFFRVDTQVTTIYPQRQEVRVLTALEPPVEGERGGPSKSGAQELLVEPDYTKAVEEAMDNAVANTPKIEDKVS